MDIHEEQLISIKDPFKAYKYSFKYKIWDTHISDKNSFVWKNYLETYYPTFFRYKTKDTTFMDYYVLLYLLESLELIKNTTIIHYSQLGLCTIPKIYEGDHLIIIQAVNSLSFLLGITNIILYRDKNQNEKGSLQCLFSENESKKILFSKEIPNVKNIKNEYCYSTTGIIHTLPQSNNF